MWHGPEQARLRWLQADLFDQQALEAGGLEPGSLTGIVEHTCFCAIDPGRRDAYIATVCRLLAPGGWLLGLFWCHRKPGGRALGAGHRIGGPAPGRMAGPVAPELSPGLSRATPGSRASRPAAGPCRRSRRCQRR
ncbi:hypothetical protein [Synechococcus sp. FACHB-909]|uniref:hypothetical protein n=1 Tax=Synechococcus sp. FACHB-909 TaxID=2692863 RepID=UPI00336A839A